MKLPGISILTLMAVVLVVALNGVAFRSIAARPEFLVGELSFAALFTLPMVSVLALACAAWQRLGPRGRRFLVGFEVVGWGIVAATFRWWKGMLEGVFTLLVRLDLDMGPWIEDFPHRETTVVYAIVPSAFLFTQMLLALVGGWVTRWGPAPRLEGSASDLIPARSWIAPLVWLVLLIAIPVIGIEVYLRVQVDPLLARLEKGSDAVVDFYLIPDFLEIPQNLGSFKGLAGTRVRVEADTQDLVLFKVMSGNGVEHAHDLRRIRITLMAGPRKGESVSIPHCALRPVP